MSENSLFRGLELKVYDGEKLLNKVIFEQRKIVIGRILSADFKIAHPKVSRIHAILELLDDGKLRLTDLASTHGTTVGGERVVEKVVSAQDEIALAGLRLMIAPLRPEMTIEQPLAEPTDESAGGSSDPSSSGPSSYSAPNVDGRELSSADIIYSKDPTQIRSLKKTARARGVLEGSGFGNELEVTVYWEDTVLHVDHFSGSQEVSIGDQPGNRYVVASGTVGPKCKFIKAKKGSVDLLLHPSMKGSIRRGDQWLSLDQLLQNAEKQVSLTQNDLAKIAVGQVNFFLMFVPKPMKTPMSPIFDQGVLFWGLQLSLAVAAALIVSLIFSLPSTIEGTVREFPERLRKVIVQSVPKQIQKREERIQEFQETQAGTEKPDAPQVTETGGNAGEGAKEQGTEGARGRPEAKAQTGITNRPKVTQPTKTVDAPKKATTTGGQAKKPTPKPKPTKTDVLESLRRSGLGLQIAQVTGGTAGDGAAGQDPLDKALSGVGGGQQSSQGPGGSGAQGTGTGGGGTAVGVGGLGTQGFAGGARGEGVGSIPGKGDMIIGTEGAGVAVMGGLSREQIRRVVEAHAGEIRLCYEQALQRDPRLFGQIKMSWAIVGGGNVVNARALENTTASQQLAGCIQNRIRTWKFPSPPVGSRADVEWPWTFRPGA